LLVRHEADSACVGVTRGAKLDEEATSAVIQILLGHSSLRSTEIYTHLTEPLRDQLRKLLCQTTDGLF
jgi:integrase